MSAQDNDIREQVRQRYAGAALRVVQSGSGGGCCSGSTLAGTDPIVRDLYNADQTDGLPADAVAASLGCGNPTALAQLEAGQVVLDLGSGGGIDVLLSAKRVGPTGKAYGLDMTDEMLALARQNQQRAGITNAEFIKGTIEDIPLPDSSIDVIISNCVINLSGDKDRVLREAFRVLRPGGRFAVSDMVLTRELPSDVRKSIELWAGCVAGALLQEDYRAKLAKAGFEQITIEHTRTYERQDVQQFTGSGACIDQDVVDQLDGAIVSAFIRASKPTKG